MFPGCRSILSFNLISFNLITPDGSTSLIEIQGVVCVCFFVHRLGRVRSDTGIVYLRTSGTGVAG
jgi:hypothetical protein